jgi:hypothetical protein
MKSALNVAEVGCKILICVLPKIREEIFRFPGANFPLKLWTTEYYACSDCAAEITESSCTKCTLRDRHTTGGGGVHFAALSARVPLAHSFEMK